MKNNSPIICIPVKEAVGLALCHDITEIVPGRKKGPAFLRGHVVREQDVEYLLRLGKEHLYVWEGDLPAHACRAPGAEPSIVAGQVHEDDAARRIARAIAGPGLLYGEPKEGRINFHAAHQGLFRVNVDLLERVNSIPFVTIATAHSMQGVENRRMLAGTRVIPLAVPESTVKDVEACCGSSQFPLLSVLPFSERRVGIVTTGSEVYHGRIQDAFGPVLHKKFTAWGSSIHSQEIVPDETAITVGAIEKALDGGADFICVTGGMSVDPDDKTPAAIRALCDEAVTYGVPVFPGAMFMLAYKGGVPVLGLPGCVMYHRASIFDLLVPRLLAGMRVTKRDIVKLAHGGLCESCPECHFPQCAFGKS